MKKIIFGILSILLITPVFAYEINPAWSTDNVLSLSNTQNNNSVVYVWDGSTIRFKNSQGYLSYLTNLPFSSNNIDYGSVIDSENYISSFIFSGFSNYSGGTFNSLLSFGVYGVSPSLDYIQLYLQRQNSGDYDGNNFLITFSSGVINPFSTDYIASSLSNSYIRLFYNNNDFNIGYSSSRPSYIEIFDNNKNYVLTNKGKVFDYAGRNNITKNWVIPSYLNGYSYVYNSGGLHFSTVMFGFNNYQNGVSYNIGSSFEFDNLLLFPAYGDNKDYNKNYLGALMLSGDLIYFSIYYCDGLQATDYGDYLLYNFDSSCTLMNGGYFSVSINGAYREYSNSLSYLLSKYNKCYYYSNGSTYSGSPKYHNPYMNIYFNYSNNQITFQSNIEGSQGCSDLRSGGLYSYTINITDIYGSIDVLKLVRGIDGGLTTGRVEDVLKTLCKSALLKPAFCNQSPSEIGTGVEGFWDLDGSGNLVYTIVDTDGDFNWLTISPDGSGGFNVSCSDQNGFGCPTLSNIGSDELSNYGSGILLNTGYYENFFFKKGYFFKCPYDYVLLDTGSFLDILNHFADLSESIGFDFMLPVNCSIAAFNEGKTFNFLSDVNLGLSPLMGQIQGPDDPRVYLYKFFDFLLSVALFFFLIKLYSLL